MHASLIQTCRSILSGCAGWKSGRSVSDGPWSRGTGRHIVVRLIKTIASKASTPREVAAAARALIAAGQSSTLTPRPTPTPGRQMPTFGLSVITCLSVMPMHPGDPRLTVARNLAWYWGVNLPTRTVCPGHTPPAAVLARLLF